MGNCTFFTRFTSAVTSAWRIWSTWSLMYWTFYFRIIFFDQKIL
jgi:hypothetical protein